MEGPPTAWRGRLSDKWICRCTAFPRDRVERASWWRLHNSDPSSAVRCPSHKSPNQPSRMSPIYFTSQFVVLGAASLPASSPPSFRLYWVLTRHVLRAPDADTRIDGLLKVITYLRSYKVLAFLSPERDSDASIPPREYRYWFSPRGRIAGKKEESHKAISVSRLKRSNLKI